MGLEIISGVERRRRWSDADKLRIVAEADEPGAKVAEVARRHEISRSILWTWRKQARAGGLKMSDPPAFLPVFVDAVSAVDAPMVAARASAVLVLFIALATTVPPLGVIVMPPKVVGAEVSTLKLVAV